MLAGGKRTSSKRLIICCGHVDGPRYKKPECEEQDEKKKKGRNTEKSRRRKLVGTEEKEGQEKMKKE